MKVSDYVAKYLEHRKVAHVYELVGGMITHLLDSIHQQTRIRLISVHHEQAASFAAEGTARMTGVPGVALATSGPGAVNLLTGVGSCYFDSTPAVFITGQVNRNEMRGERAIRQLGFQETDIVAMAKPITKGSWLAGSPEEVPELLRSAFDLALAGRPGPVLIDLPMDVQRGQIEDPTIPAAREKTVAPPRDLPLDDLWADLAKAKHPLILAGGGVRAAWAVEPFRTFAERLNVPVVHSLLGVDVLPYDHPLRIGMIGTYGNRWANMALGKADFLLVLGSRLDVRQTGADTKAFTSGKIICHVDVEAGEINNRVAGCKAVVVDLATFLRVAVEETKGRTFASWPNWLTEIAEARLAWPDTEELATVPGINPNVLMHWLSQRMRNAAGYVVDVGQHQMWAAQSLELGSQQRFLTSGGMGSMGFALPAGIGAALAAPGRSVVVIAGDGGFQCNIQELQTVVRNTLPLKLVVVDNASLGMVRQFQESYFDKRYLSTVWGYSAPDFAAVAQGYGIPGRKVEAVAALGEALDWLADQAGPALLSVRVDMHANAYPKIAFGQPITEMEPFAKPTDMEGT